MPIDDSTASVALGFFSLYKAGCGELYLAKALALADQLTRMQHENGQIIRSVKQVTAEDRIVISVSDGAVTAAVLEAKERRE